MDKINVLSDDLLVKILSFVPTKVAISTSILSKRWEFLWMWVPNIDYDDYRDITLTNRSPSSFLRYQDFINKNLPLHKVPIIESLHLTSSFRSHQLEDIKLWVGMAISRCVQELIIDRYFCLINEPHVVFPSSLYTCKTLVTLKLDGRVILVDVPQKGCLPSLKTLKLKLVTYLNQDYLRLLLSYCPVLEHLVIKRHKDDKVKALVFIVPSLQRLSLEIDCGCSSDKYVIDTPSLKYLKVHDHRYEGSCEIRRMPKLEEADLFLFEDLQEFLESITSVRRLSLQVYFNNDDESMCSDGIVFNQLEHLKLCWVHSEYWSKLLVRLLNDSPKLRVLNLKGVYPNSRDSELISWSNERSLGPKCLLKSLETIKFTGYKGRREERDFLSFIFKNARCLKSTSILSSLCDD